jgi:Fur family peroxide stress response transcriptional regulator
VKRMTKQRKTILEVIRSTTCHPTAEWIYEQARKVIPEISLGTIYRNLQVLVQEQEIQELKYGSTFSRFDGNTHPHYHFVCLKCGQVYDLNMPVLTKLNQQAAKIIGGSVESHRLVFYGACQQCEKEEAEVSSTK